MHVYCTDCKHFKLTCDMPDECFECYCKDCDCIDLEDSKDIEIRHKFEQKNANNKYKVDYINPKTIGMKVSMEDRRIIKITHIESGISVTKSSGRSHLDAKSLAEKELEELVKIWESR